VERDSTPDGIRGAALTTVVSSALRAAAVFMAYVWTGSSALLATTVHALADLSSQALLVAGRSDRKQRNGAAQPPPEMPLLGLVATMLLHALGAGIALTEGASGFATPRKIDLHDPALALIAGAVIVTLAAAWRISAMLPARHDGQGLVAALRARSATGLLVLVLESRAALGGLLLAGLALAGATRLAVPAADAAAALAIGLVMAAVAAVLALEIKELAERREEVSDDAALGPGHRGGAADAPIPADGSGSPAHASAVASGAGLVAQGEPASRPMSRKERKKAKRHKH
jgi:divalent metal cation (Fe/Co/Zn/Cd) transporter